MTRLCVPLTADTCQKMAQEIDAATQAGAEMIELRLDYLREWNSDLIVKLMARAEQFDGEVIATCRIAEEGGKFEFDELQRVGLLELAGQNGADYIDVEFNTWKESAYVRDRIGKVCGIDKRFKQARSKLILSKHDFERTPADLDAILAEIAREPAHVVKLACKAETITDSVRMLAALKNSAAIRPTIALSMSETGILTRVLAKKFGALLTFTSLETGKESAPGQLSISEMRSLYRWDALKANTKVYGVIGCPVAHSMSPAIHNTAFGEIRYNGIYLPLQVEPDYESFATFIDACRSLEGLDLRGCSVTIPHKENLLRYVEQQGGEVESLSKRIGVANTLCIDPIKGGGDKLCALNTDYRGAMDALCDGMGISGNDLGNLSVAILGAGGVSRAIVAGLRDRGCNVTIYNRTGAKAEKLAEEFDCTAKPWDQRGDLTADAVINCTSIGMWPDTEDTPLSKEAISNSHPAVFDTVYNPIETRLLREARELGCKTVDGVAMFVNQAVAQFERWTDKQAPVDVMRDVVIARLSN